MFLAINHRVHQKHHTNISSQYNITACLGRNVLGTNNGGDVKAKYVKMRPSEHLLCHIFTSSLVGAEQPTLHMASLSSSQSQRVAFIPKPSLQHRARGWPSSPNPLCSTEAEGGLHPQTLSAAQSQRVAFTPKPSVQHKAEGVLHPQTLSAAVLLVMPK
jgi:hypothetical protein